MKKTTSPLPFRLDTFIFITVALVALALLVGFGILKPPHAIALAVGAVVMIFALQFLGAGNSVTWRRQTQSRRAGARDETSELAWMLFGRDSTISFGGRRYVNGVAGRVVATRGLDLTNPEHFGALADLLGPRVTSLLVSPDQEYSLPEVRHILEALEASLDESNQRTPHA